MRFNCGPTIEEREEILEVKFQQWAAAVAEWRRVFLWLPKRVEGTRDCLWLEFIECRARKVYWRERYVHRIFGRDIFMLVPHVYDWEYRVIPRSPA